MVLGLKVLTCLIKLIGFDLTHIKLAQLESDILTEFADPKWFHYIQVSVNNFFIFLFFYFFFHLIYLIDNFS